MTRPFRCPWLLLASIVLVASATRVGAQSPTRCAAIKAKATGSRMAGSLACYATATRTGTIASFACLTGAEKKFDRLFAKADTKGPCGMVGDAATIGDSVAAFAEGIAAGLFPAGAPDAARRCAAIKLQRAGAYSRGRLACWAQAFGAGVGLDSSCVDKVVSKLASGFTAAEAKGTCGTAGDLPTIEAALNGFIDAVASLLMPPPTTTTTAPLTSTTTAPSGGGTTTTLSTTTTTIAPGVVSLSVNVQPILTANCAVAGCHTGAKPAQGLDLSAGHAYGSLVNVASGECPLFKRVLPTRPDQSYLVFKLGGPPQPCFSGNQMPSGGRAPLSAADQNTISTWITQGALNN